jgi:hypothetical protein
LLALEDEGSINPAVLEKLEELAKQGAVIIGEKPKKMDQIANYPASGSNEKNRITQLWTNIDNPSKVVLDKNGKIYSGITPLEMLQVIRVQPDIVYPGKESELLDFIHFRKTETDIYFIRNTRNEWLSRNVGFRQQNNSPEIWNPVSGEIIPVPIFNRESEYVNLPVTLPPFGSGWSFSKNHRLRLNMSASPETGNTRRCWSLPLMELRFWRREISNCQILHNPFL